MSIIAQSVKIECGGFMYGQLLRLRCDLLARRSTIVKVYKCSAEAFGMGNFFVFDAICWHEGQQSLKCTNVVRKLLVWTTSSTSMRNATIVIEVAYDASLIGAI